MRMEAPCIRVSSGTREDLLLYEPERWETYKTADAAAMIEKTA